MKCNRVFRILALAVILSLLMLAIPAAPALAASVSLSVTSGSVGTPVTVTGDGFAASTSGRVWFDSDDDGSWDSGEPYLSATTNASGVLSASGTITVPTVPRGIYQVRVDILPSGVDAEADFTVTPQITLSTTSGYVGNTVTVSGTGFLGGAGITILFDGVSKGTTTALTNGTFTGFSLTVPECPKGSYPIKAQETSATTYNATATFTVSAKITITPTSGAVGDTVTISGTGFAADSDITVYFDGDEVDITGGDDDTDSDGSFSGTTFTIPSTSRGSHTVKVKDEDGNYATATFTVSAKITIAPASGGSGITVTVTGTGFGASKPITIKYDDDPVTTTPATVTTGTTGNFTATFTIPASLAGTYVVEASDVTNTATADFVSTTDATISQTTTATTPGHVGMQLVINGTHFKASSTITITYASEPVVFTTTSLADGSFSYILTIPPSEGGAHTITVTDGYTTKEFAFYMELTPPEVPSLVLPLVDTKAESETTFDWAAVEDDSEPVIYDLQVATDEEFSEDSILVEKEELAESKYTLLTAEKLESTGKEAPYYWRVRAVDAASNASDWSDADTFYVGFMFEITGWLLYLLMGVGGLLLFFFGFWLGRRSTGGEYF